jgi:hypothetical protein
VSPACSSIFWNGRPGQAGMVRLVSNIRDRGIGMTVCRRSANSAGPVHSLFSFYSRGVVRESAAQSEISF